MINRLDPPLPVVTPKGAAMAHFLLDYGFEHHLMWICFQDETGECWTWENPQVRLQLNQTANRLSRSLIGGEKDRATP